MRESGPNAPSAGSDGFERWMEATPNGYFVNLTGPRSGRLHRATCPHMKFGERVNLVSRRKWASDSRTALVDRARRGGYRTPPVRRLRCLDCTRRLTPVAPPHSESIHEADVNVDLTPGEIETLLTSLEYSKQRIRDAPDTPYAVRQENLARLDAVAEKLRSARNS